MPPQQVFLLEQGSQFQLYPLNNLMWESSILCGEAFHIFKGIHMIYHVILSTFFLWSTFLMSLKVQTPFLVPCNTVITALQDSSFSHQQINFITCLMGILSLCTFTSGSLVTAMSTVSGEFKKVLTDIQASAGLPNLCAHQQNLVSEESWASITLSWTFPELTEVGGTFP